jgi:alpha-tubulin suppressor-like RCC1 family protein
MHKSFLAKRCFMMGALVGAIIMVASLALGAVTATRATIACGLGHTLAIKADGSLWAWGYNGFGQLGLGDNADRHNPTRVETNARNWVAVAAGNQHSLGLRADGTLWAWGAGDSGQLGQGNYDDQLLPKQVGTGSNWVAIAAGSHHSLGIKSDGTLWSWGWGSYGQLGHGNTDTLNLPTQVGRAENWVAVAGACGSDGGGGDYSLGLRADGTLWAWGDNTDGELGLSDNTERDIPTPVGSATNWTAIAAGAWHCLGLRADGTLWAWGFNSSGELGLGNTTDQNSPTRVEPDKNWAAIAAGTRHSLAVRTDGTLWGTGLNTHGELGLDDDVTRLSFVRVGTDIHWFAVAAGEFYSLGLRADGTLWAWGFNGWGQLGLGDTDNRYEPVQVPGKFKRGKALPWLLLLLN